MKKICVLVTGIGSCGAAEGVVKALRLVKDKYRIVGTDVNSLSALSFRVDVGYKVPRATDPGYMRRINEICAKEHVDVLIPGSDAEMEFIANHVGDLTANVFLLAHPQETVNICRDSYKTYLFLKKHGFACPESYIPEEPKQLPFPLFIKDRFGGGSKYANRVENQHELDHFLDLFKRKKIQPLIREFIGSMDEEYTTGVLYDKEGSLISSVTFKRTLIAGASGSMICNPYPEVTKNAEAIVAKLKTFGSLNIQCRLVNGKPYVFEINPRFSGSSPARAGVGVNEVDMAIDHFYLGKKVTPPSPQYGTVIMRCFQEIYADIADWEKLDKGEAVSHKGRIHDYV